LEVDDGARCTTAVVKSNWNGVDAVITLETNKPRQLLYFINGADYTTMPPPINKSSDKKTISKRITTTTQPAVQEVVRSVIARFHLAEDMAEVAW
tara:strand:- start:2056 stop:2340 length:285 start_codon:yes stop_codon:yes gene_type:complete